MGDDCSLSGLLVKCNASAILRVGLPNTIYLLIPMALIFSYSFSLLLITNISSQPPMSTSEINNLLTADNGSTYMMLYLGQWPVSSFNIGIFNSSIILVALNPIIIFVRRICGGASQEIKLPSSTSVIVGALYRVRSANLSDLL